jgi:general stress protein 26
MTSDDKQDEGARKVAELLQDSKIAMLTTHAPDGTLVSRPMAMQEVEFDGDIWFFADRHSHAVAHVTADPQVNVAVSGSSSWVSLTGGATVVDDVAKKRELWNSVVEAWFPDGPDADHIVLVHVDGWSAEYWDSPGGRVASLISYAKAKVTGKPYDGGENEKVQL